MPSRAHAHAVAAPKSVKVRLVCGIDVSCLADYRQGASAARGRDSEVGERGDDLGHAAHSEVGEKVKQDTREKKEVWRLSHVGHRYRR
jgi:hypothetical protein